MFGWLKKKEKLDMRWAYGALVAYIIMMVANWLAGATNWLGGKNTAAVSDSYPNLFAPSGFTFAIWGLIYLLLGLFFFRMFAIWKPKKSAITNRTLNQLVVLFTVSSVLNALWLLAWQYDVIWLSVIVMVGLLVTLIRINQLLVDKLFGLKEYALVRMPFSVYFGWITIATIANVTTWLVSADWSGWGLSEGAWMVVVLLIGAVIVLLAALKNRDPAYLAVGVWAYTGILAKHLSDTGFNGKYPTTIVTLTILLAVFLSVLVRLAPYVPYRLKD